MFLRVTPLHKEIADVVCINCQTCPFFEKTSKQTNVMMYIWIFKASIWEAAWKLWLFGGVIFYSTEDIVLHLLNSLRWVSERLWSVSNMWNYLIRAFQRKMESAIHFGLSVCMEGKGKKKILDTPKCINVAVGLLGTPPTWATWTWPNPTSCEIRRLLWRPGRRSWSWRMQSS